MKRTVFIFGLIAGLIVGGMMSFTVVAYHNNPDYEGSMLLGYAGMLIAFAFIFVGIKSLRDKHYGGVISFGKAFKAGLLITLIASTIYVLVWLVEYYCYIPDFMDRYTNHMLKEAQRSGADAAAIAKKTAEMATYRELYKNPLFVILLTYAEILPVGLLVSLICALILKRKPKQPELLVS